MASFSQIFFLMNHLFCGFLVSIGYSIVAGLLIYYTNGRSDLTEFLELFYVDFLSVVSGGLGFSAFILVWKTQNYIPENLERIFDKIAENEEYLKSKERYFSARRSFEFGLEFAFAGFFIFLFAGFPCEGYIEYMLISFACIQYSCGVYVGRKIFYIAQMLNAAFKEGVKRSMFRDNCFGNIISYVNSISIVIMFVVYSNVMFYFNGPFLFQSILGESVKTMLLLPAIIATPVIIIFNFYPKASLYKIYSTSIELEVAHMTRKLREVGVSEIEKINFLVEYDKIKREELNNRLKTTISDISIAIPILISIASILK